MDILSGLYCTFFIVAGDWELVIKLQFHHYEQWPRLVLGPRHAWHPQPLPPPLPPSTNSTGRNIRRRHRKLKEISRLRILYLGWSIWEEDCASNSALPCDQRKGSLSNTQFLPLSIEPALNIRGMEISYAFPHSVSIYKVCRAWRKKAAGRKEGRKEGRDENFPPEM